VSREVSFSFDSEDQKDVFRTMARKRGQTLSQFVRWCAFKYLRDREANSAGNRARRTLEAETGGNTEIGETL